MKSEIEKYPFLAGMYRDGYFPDHLVDRVKDVILDLCSLTEMARPGDQQFLGMCDEAIENINELQEAFWEADSEIETVGREVICADFSFVATAYGFGHLDSEELTRKGEW